MTVEVKHLPGYRLVCARHVGPYGPDLGEAWGRVMNWAGQKGLRDVAYIGISHDDPGVTPADQCRYDACIVVPDAAVANVSKQELQDAGLFPHRLPGGPHACHRRPTRMNEFHQAFRELCAWLSGSEWDCAGIPFEYYHPQEGDCQAPDFAWDVSFCVPVKPRVS